MTQFLGTNKAYNPWRPSIPSLTKYSMNCNLSRGLNEDCFSLFAMITSKLFIELFQQLNEL